MKILIVGDVHGHFNALGALIDQEQPDVVISTGDFGFFPAFTSIFTPQMFKRNKVPIYFCEGNHDDHWALRDLKDESPIEVASNVFYMKRGTRLVLDNQTYMFMGGANSVDKAWRIYGSDWFPEEVLSESDLYGLQDDPVDVIISHAAPDEFKLNMTLLPMVDPSRAILSYILNKYQPVEWYCSHYHIYQQGAVRNKRMTQWTVLNKATDKRWYYIKGEI